MAAVINPSPTLLAVQNIIAEVTSYEPNDIQPSFHFEDDLQLDMVTDFPSVINRINQHFSTTFVAKELMNEIETVDELVERVEDETELG